MTILCSEQKCSEKAGEKESYIFQILMHSVIELSSIFVSAETIFNHLNTGVGKHLSRSVAAVASTVNVQVQIWLAKQEMFLSNWELHVAFQILLLF